MTDELERLRRWKAEAMPLFDGLQDLGRALNLPLGVLVTGPVAIEAANRLWERAETAEAAVERVRAILEAWDGSPGPDGGMHPDSSSPRDRERLRQALDGAQ